MNAGEQLPLRDIHLPAQPGWWPPAPGWWLLAAVVLLLVLAAAWWHRSRRRSQGKPRPGLTALAQLQQVREQWRQQKLDGRAAAAASSALLRETAMRHHGSHHVAGLSGEDWLNFLDRTGDTDAFTQGPGRLLQSAPYGGASGDTGALLRCCEEWLNKHAH